MIARRVFPLLFAAALLIGLGGAAWAQFGGRGTPSVSSPAVSDLLGLVQRADVQQELRLDRHQRAVVADLQDQFQTTLRERMRPNFGGGQALSPEERQRQLTEMRARTQAAREALQAD